MFRRVAERSADPSCFLECEGETASEHSEVVLRSVDDIPTEVIHPADVRGNPEFQPAPKLPTTSVLVS